MKDLARPNNDHKERAPDLKALLRGKKKAAEVREAVQALPGKPSLGLLPNISKMRYIRDRFGQKR
jgi:hypothetical protein